LNGSKVDAFTEQNIKLLSLNKFKSDNELKEKIKELEDRIEVLKRQVKINDD